MARSQSTFRSVVGATVGIVALAVLTGCGSDPDEGAAPEEQASSAWTTPSSEAPTSSAAETSSGAPGSSESALSSPQPPSSEDPAPSEPQPAPATALAGPGTLCGTVPTPYRGPAPVAVLTGQVDCEEAMTTAHQYFAGPEDGSLRQGNSGQATVGRWNCGVAVLADRPQAMSYLRCGDQAGNAFRIGE